MNIKAKQIVIVPLNESKSNIEPKIPLNNNLLEIVMKTKAKQFKFDCGAIMAKIDIKLNNKFGLNWHYVNTTNEQEFYLSVEKFLSASSNKLSDDDHVNLEKQYAKYHKKQLKS